MIEWINNNWIEIIGAALAFIYIVLEIKKKWFFWIAGIISSAFYVYIFLCAGLYAQMGLNGYYILMCAYGLYCWKFASESSDENFGFQRINVKTTFILTGVSVILFGLIFVILHQFTDSKILIVDTLIAVLSIIATWMAAKKIVECWYIWIFSDIIATSLYIHQKLYPTAILFTAYCVLSVLGLIEWQKSVKSNDSAHTKL